jgi:hypothetical protein
MALNERHMTLGVISFGLAIGVTWAIAVFMLGLAAWLFDWGIEVASALSSLYIGYGPSFVGAITGAVWGFVDGLVLGAMIALLYNRFLLRRRKTLPPQQD